MAGDVKISAVVVAQNEEKNIRRCLSSLGFADEVVVVDALSEDGTARIAREMGARVISRRWSGFADQKQFAVDAARGEWVFLIDADEEVTPALSDEIREAVTGGGAPGAFRVQRCNYFLGRQVRHGPWARDRQTRLFRKRQGRIARRPVHEGVQTDITPGLLQNPLNHYTHQTLSESFDRLNRYTSLEAPERVHRRKIRLVDTIVPPTAVFIRYYLVKGLWRSGVSGLLLAAITAMYKSVLYIKVFFLQRGRHEHSAP